MKRKTKNKSAFYTRTLRKKPGMLSALEPRRNGRTGMVALQKSGPIRTGLLQRSLKRQKTFYAIEFDAGLIKFIAVSGEQRKTVRALKVKMLSSPQDAEMGKVLAELMREQNIARNSEVTICLPRHAMHLKNIRLPSQNPRELEKMTALYVQKEIPLPADEVVYDYAVTGADEAGYSDIMLILARRSQVNRYVEICARAGLQVCAVRVNVEVMYHAFRQTIAGLPQLGSDCIALIDVDFSSINILFLHRGRLLLTRSLQYGISNLIDSLVDKENPEKYQSWIAKLGKSILESLAFFRQEISEPEIDRIILTGWLPRLSTFMYQLQDHIGLPVSWFDPVVSLRPFIQTESENIQHQWFSILSLLGTSIARSEDLMDLRPQELKRTQRASANFRKGVAAAGLALYLAGLWAAGLHFSLQHRQAAAAELQQKIQALLPQIQATQRAMRLERFIDRELGSRTPTTPLLAQVFEKMPADIELTYLTFRRGQRVVVRGIAKSMQSVLNFAKLLETQPGFAAVAITSANRVAKDNSTISFEVKITLPEAGKK